jgi:hypothetical protein
MAATQGPIVLLSMPNGSNGMLFISALLSPENWALCPYKAPIYLNYLRPI